MLHVANRWSIAYHIFGELSYYCMFFDLLASAILVLVIKVQALTSTQQSRSSGTLTVTSTGSTALTADKLQT